MIKTINLTTDIPLDREMRVVLPDDVPVGLADIVVVIAPHRIARQPTLNDFLNSEFFGMWRDRDDIGDSVEYARQLRAQAWERAA